MGGGWCLWGKADDQVEEEEEDKDVEEDFASSTSSDEIVIFDEERFFVKRAGLVPKLIEETKAKVGALTVSEYGLWRKDLTTEEMEEALRKSNFRGQNLKLSYNKMQQIPTPVFRMECLRELSLQDNCLTSLPSLVGLRGLRKLYISNNPELRKIPKLPPCLSHLYASNIGLEEIPVVCSNANLTYLSLFGNRIKTIPAFLAECVALVELDLSQNLLWRVPLAMRNLVRLDCLFLRKNQLPAAMNRNIVAQGKIQHFFEVVVKCFETFYVMFMCWSRLRNEPREQYGLGDLPRDLLWIISGKI